MTSLDSPTTAVIGFKWLARHNPLVDWAQHTITFETPAQAVDPTTSATSKSPPVTLSTSDPPPTPPSPTTGFSTPDHSPPAISIIGAAAFTRAARLPGSEQYRFAFRCANSSSDPDTPDLSSIPVEYHDFAEVFSDVRANTLANHRPYDLHIDLEEGQAPTPGPIYSLSQVELKALREFIEENLTTGFIRQSASSHGAPVLFVKKKDGSLRLCVDYR